MKQKIILLDIDGTIYDQKGHIPDSTRQAIKKQNKKDIQYCFVPDGPKERFRMRYGSLIWMG